MAYEYDVFLSYSHDLPFGEWVKDPFLPLFQGYLKAALNKSPRIFVDHEIPTGHSWNMKLKNALAKSKCLVGIWSPNYFQSEWCKLECFIMLHRESVVSYRTLEKPNGLIVPVSVHDGEKFPKFAKAIQYENWQGYAIIGDGFKKTERYVELQDKICNWAEDVAQVITGAPRWNPDWLKMEWFEKVFPQWLEDSKVSNLKIAKRYLAPQLWHSYMKQGQIVTFYSYKGGVGRTMALANVAVLLARWGYKTLIVDWDLEAPGLEHFFKDYLDLKRTKNTEGIVDILNSVNKSKYQTHIDWKNFLVDISPPPNNIPFSLLTAGKRGRNYFKKVRKFDLESFYTKNKGGEFIESLRNEWKKNYDFILIDSRTGVTDIGGICTIQLPDILVSFFTATEQSLQGIIDIIQRAWQGRQKLPVDRLNLLSIPVPSRFDTDKEFEIGQDWLKKFAIELSDVYSDWLPKNISVRDFLEITKLPYISYFSFGEELAVIKQGVSDPTGLGYAYETLAAIIANNLESAERLINNRAEFVLEATLKPALHYNDLKITEVSDTPRKYSPEIIDHLADQLYERALDLEKENRSDEAAAFARKAIEAWQEIIENDFITFGQKLARGRRFLSEYFTSESDLFGAITEANASIDLYRRLHQISVSEFSEELAEMLFSLSNLLIETNQFAEALTVAQETVTIYQALITINKEQYEPDLASSLNLVSECLFNAGDIVSALSSGKKAADIFRYLALENPKRFDADLASSLNALLDQISQLSLEKVPNALLLARQSIEDFRNLVSRNPKRYEPDLARNLNVLTDLYLEKGSFRKNSIQEALVAQNESINIFRRLALSNPAPYLPEIASSLVNLSKLQFKNKDFGGAREAADEALEIFKRLSQTSPTRYKEDVDEVLELVNKLPK